MSKQIWLGPVLGNNRARLLARCGEYISHAKTERLLYIAASHPLLELVTEKLLDGKSAPGLWGDFPVYLFRGFVKRVLSAAAVSTGAPRIPIDREELPLRRSLISQIIKQLSARGSLKAIKPLANRDGCVNTIASLIGELQRAGKTAVEFDEVIQARERDAGIQSPESKVQSPKSQLDFDRDVARIYSAYTDILERFGLTDEDADQLQVLQILRAHAGGHNLSQSWLADVELLVLDGFFDFTPVQGEILRQLIPLIPRVIVNLNHDQNNREIFRPFDSTVEQLKSIADFELEHDRGSSKANGEPALRERLFNVAQVNNLHDENQEQPQPNGLRYVYYECGDRETEIRTIARQIKQLVLNDGYSLADIGVVVRERSAYAETILRVCTDESIPCNLERRIEASEIPCVRACTKLFDLFREFREHVTNPKTSELAHLLKSGYFRISRADLSALMEDFDSRYGHLLLADPDERTDPENTRKRLERLRSRLGIGDWRPDVLENVFAYVGSELRVDAWLVRAKRLIAALPSAEAARAFISSKDAVDGDDAAAVTEREPPEDLAEKTTMKTPAPVHPSAIAWTIVVVERLRSLISDVPATGAPEDLRRALMLLLEQFEFSQQVTRPFLRTADSSDIPQLTLNMRGLESLRRAMAAAVRSFNYARSIGSEARSPEEGILGRSASTGNGTENLLARGQLTVISLASFIDELERALRSQILSIGSGNRDGLKVLEATDVRGLRFRVLFIAGMTEGGFPLRTSGDWLYPHEERERLQKYGVALEDISNETLLKEEHYFYQAACRTTERLYLSRPIALDDGTETIPSYYIQELKRAIAPVQLETISIRGDIDQRDLQSSSNINELATLLIRQSERRNPPSTVPKSLLQRMMSDAATRGVLSKSAMRRVSIELQRNGAWFGPFDGEISTPELRAMLARHFGAGHVYSASSLSTYGKCPFRFFASRVLKLEPRNEAALDLLAIDAGKLLHEILRRFFERHRGQYLPSRDRKELRVEMGEVADQVFREHETLVPAINERIWKIDCEIRKLILDQVLLYELRLQKKTNARGMRPAFFELAFGRSSSASDPNSRSDYLLLERPDASETSLIQGQIDRVDVNTEDRIAIAYDYKLNQGAKPPDIVAAREIQIPIYLAALEQLFVPGYELAGGGYYRLRPRAARLNQGLYRRLFADCTIVTGKNLHPDADWRRIRETVRRRVWNFIDGMRKGDFRVRPTLGKQTCKFCDFDAVCRYDTYRIGRKRS